VKEKSKVIWGKLQAKYMPVPNKHDWEEISKVFFEKCNVPICIGSTDGKHCRLKCPAKAGSLSYNYKGYHSIVLMAIADANCFTVIDVGAYRRQSDSSVFNKSNMGNAFFSGRLGILNPHEIPQTTIKILFFFLSAMKLFC
jgi:hypothetical protein